MTDQALNLRCIIEQGLLQQPRRTVKRAYKSWLAVVSMLAVGVFEPNTTQAHDVTYHYVSLDDAKLPAGFAQFYAYAISDNGRVYGSVCDTLELCEDQRIAYYEDGAIRVTEAKGWAQVVNAEGVVGGYVTIDPVNFTSRAAIFWHGKTEVIPPQSDEVNASVIALNDRGEALVSSYDSLGNTSFVLYSRGRTTRLDFGPSVATPTFWSNGSVLNDRDTIVGITGDLFDGARGFRYDVRRGIATQLDPTPTDSLAWALAINQHGYVLGYSFSPSTPTSSYVEHVGVWDRRGKFHTYFTEDLVSNNLLFNDDNLIVITQTNTLTSYIVPEPGTRLDLADLVTDLPADTKLWIISDVNNQGSMIGQTARAGSFLLERQCQR